MTSLSIAGKIAQKAFQQAAKKNSPLRQKGASPSGRFNAPDSQLPEFAILEQSTLSGFQGYPSPVPLDYRADIRNRRLGYYRHFNETVPERTRNNRTRLQQYREAFNPDKGRHKPTTPGVSEWTHNENQRRKPDKGTIANWFIPGPPATQPIFPDLIIPGTLDKEREGGYPKEPPWSGLIRRTWPDPPDIREDKEKPPDCSDDAAVRDAYGIPPCTSRGGEFKLEWLEEI